MPSQQVIITDVILRDDHQSLVATRLRTEVKLPGCAMLDDMETEITAPIAGVVSALHVVKGELANLDEVLIEIVA